MSSRTLLATAALAALLPLAAHADSGVSIQARSSAAGNGAGGESVYSWNYYTDGVSISPQSATSTGSVVGSATSATATARDTGLTAAGATMGTSTISGDLATASMSASVANAGFVQAYGDVGGHPFGAINDVLTFTAAGAGADTVSTIGVTFTVQDTLSGASTHSIGSYLYNTFAIGKDAESRVGVNPDGSIYVTPDVYPSAWDGTWAVTGTGDNHTLTFTGELTFQGASWTAPFREYTDLYCWDDVQCATHSSVAFDLSPGVTMTSQSGVFLTAGSPSAVPEPQNGMLLLAGLGMLGMAARRRAMRPRG